MSETDFIGYKQGKMATTGDPAHRCQRAKGNMERQACSGGKETVIGSTRVLNVNVGQPNVKQ